MTLTESVLISELNKYILACNTAQQNFSNWAVENANINQLHNQLQSLQQTAAKRLKRLQEVRQGMNQQIKIAYDAMRGAQNLKYIKSHEGALKYQQELNAMQNQFSGICVPLRNKADLLNKKIKDLFERWASLSNLPTN